MCSKTIISKCNKAMINISDKTIINGRRMARPAEISVNIIYLRMKSNIQVTLRQDFDSLL